MKPYQTMSAYYELIKKESLNYNVPIPIILGVIQKESGGNPVAVGNTGDFGLMQITQGALTDFNQYNQTNYKIYELLKPDLNIMVGVWYLKHLHTKSNNWQETLQKYNAGIGNYNKNPQVSMKYASDVLYYANLFAQQLNIKETVYV